MVIAKSRESFCAPLVLGDELQKIRLEILGDFEL
jgi:hypothetical protein